MKKYFETQNDQTYCLEVSIANTENNNKPNTASLNQDSIGLFRCVNEINDPCPTATLDYIDDAQLIDRYVGKQYVVCSIILSHIMIKDVGGAGVKTEKEPEKTCWGFLVNNIEILERHDKTIHYRLHLISTIWTKLMKRVKFTNYKKPERDTVIDILKTICEDNKIPIDCESFSKCKSTSELKYISGNNDNFYTCYRYLMNKSFYNQANVKDGALKGILFNDKLEKLCMFDFTNDFKYQGLVNANISMLKNKTYDLEGSEEVNIACVLNKTNTERMEGLFPTLLYSYNFETNEIENETTDSRVIRGYCSGHSRKNENNVPMYDENKYTKDYSDWDNNMNLYNSSFSSVKDYNGLIVNIAGAMSVNPGWKCGVSIRSVKEPVWWDKEAMVCPAKTGTAESYRQFEGGWYVSKVVHLVNPMKQMFRQNLYLMRTENMVP